MFYISHKTLKFSFGKLINMQYLNCKTRHCSIRYAHQKSIYNREEAKKVKFFVIDRYILYLKNYDKTIEVRFPNAIGIYRTFMEGIKSFLGDVKLYYNIIRLLNTEGKSFKNLTRKEIELYYQMPKDMVKLAPVLILSTLPFANYVLLPLIYFFPRQLLCSHFWNFQQKIEFNRLSLQDRLLHNRPIFRHIQSQLDVLRNKPNNDIYETWKNILGMIGSGTHPSSKQILECMPLFSDEPYHLSYISGDHVRHLLKLHNLHTGIWFRRRRLANKYIILREMDKAILREGGVHNLTNESLRLSCYLRGLDSTNMKTDDMVRWLRKWIAVSKNVNKESMSLLLHCPILLAYNAPSNWTLIYSDKM